MQPSLPLMGGVRTELCVRGTMAQAPGECFLAIGHWIVSFSLRAHLSTVKLVCLVCEGIRQDEVQMHVFILQDTVPIKGDIITIRAILMDASGA